MKFLLALLMLLTFASCTAEEVPVYDQEHIDVTLEPEALYTAMNERGVVGIHETGNAVYSSFVAPIMYQSEEKGYLLPNVPEEVILSGTDTAVIWRWGYIQQGRIRP